MEKTYKCPVCGVEFTDLSALRACIANDEIRLKKKAEEEAARAKAQAAEQAAQKQRYINAIKESRADIEKIYATLKTKVDAYNRLVNEATQKSGIDSPLVKSTLTFSGVWGSFDKDSSLSKEVREAAERVISKIDKTSNDCNDLATIIFKNLGF